MEGGAGHVVRRLDFEFFGSYEFFQHLCDSFSGKPIGSVKHPDEFDSHLAANKAGPLGSQPCYQTLGRFCLGRIIRDQTSN